MVWDESKLRTASIGSRKSESSHHGIVRAHVEQITAARAAGNTWASIAAALGMKVSRQTIEGYYRAAIGQPRRKRAAAAPATEAASTTVVSNAPTATEPESEFGRREHIPPPGLRDNEHQRRFKPPPKMVSRGED